jgi:hypothetical protein
MGAHPITSKTMNKNNEDAKEMSGLQGICPDCGAIYYGCALQSLPHQVCEFCGAALTVRKNGVLLRRELSPLKALEHPADSNQGGWGDLCEKDLEYHLTIN